jgi:hypothetical protein
MSSKFQLANELAILSIGRRISWTAGGTYSSDDDTAAPALDSDGLALGGAVVGLLTAKTAPGETGEIKVWTYSGDSTATPPEGNGWCVARNGVLAVDEFGVSERLTVAGYKRIYVQWSVSPATEALASFGLGVSE